MVTSSRSTPINLYENPVNKFVAGFMGSPQMNFINAKLIMLNGKYTVEFGSEDTKTTRGRKFYVELPGAKADTEALKYYVDKGSYPWYPSREHSR